MATVKNPLDELLNKIEAICETEKGLLADLSRFLLPDQGRGVRQTRASEWVKARTRRPNGETALRMEQWAAEKTLEISADKAKAAAYRKAFKEVERVRNG